MNKLNKNWLYKKNYLLELLDIEFMIWYKKVNIKVWRVFVNFIVN